MCTMPRWDAGLYLRFAEERTQPARDLIARIAIGTPSRIVDLGCGPGNSTAMLRERWPGAEITGLDNSPDMIAAARAASPEAAGAAHANVRWELADAATWTAAPPVDLVFSNAALQWVRHHDRVFPHLLSQVRPGGALAVQMPAHFESPLHRLILEIAEAPRWRDRTRGASEVIWVGRPSYYYDILQPLAARLEMWETEYQHVLAGHAAIVDWIRGTGLRPFLEALASDAERTDFEAALLDGVSRAYPLQRDGRVLFPFRRVFILAYA